MVNLCLEAQGRRLEGVFGGKAEMQVEDSALWNVSEAFLVRLAVSQNLGKGAPYFIRRAFGTVNENLPLVYVCLGG